MTETSDQPFITKRDETFICALQSPGGQTVIVTRDGAHVYAEHFIEGKYPTRYKRGLCLRDEAEGFGREQIKGAWDVKLVHPDAVGTLLRELGLLPPLNAPGQPRTIGAIAREIEAVWSTQGKGVNYAAAPYLKALRGLRDIKDSYYQDSAQSCILYFLSNATTFKGEDARRLKAELKAHLPAGGR